MIWRKLFTVTLISLILLPVAVDGQTFDDARAAIRVRDYASAVNIYESLARSGDAEAACQLATMYRVGRGVEKDPELANEWMSAAATAGDVHAQYGMGQLLLSESENQENRASARAWFEKAALQNHAMATEALQAMEQPSQPVLTGMTMQQRQKTLNQAIRQGDAEIVRSLLAVIQDESPVDSGQRPPLLEAITAGHTEIIEILLQSGANPNGISHEDVVSDRLIPLHCAVRSEKPAIVSMLLTAGADVDGRDRAGNTALIIAASIGNDDMVLALLAGGASIESVDNREWTALIAARQHNYQRIEQILLEHGAVDPMKADDSRRIGEVDLTHTAEGQAGWTALMYAAWRGEVDVVRQVLESRPDVNATDKDGHTALSRAAWRGHVEIVRILLDAGADPNSRHNNGFTPLLWATQYGHLEVIRSLVIAHASLSDAQPTTGYSALLLACFQQDKKAADLLLALGADINWRSPTNLTALMIAAAGESSELLQQLLIDGADLDLMDKRGRSAVWYSINSGRPQNLTLLLDSGASTDIRGNSTQHPLIQAISKGDSASVQVLFQYGIHPDVLSTSGNSTLSIAAAVGNTQIMHLLLQAGAKPNLQNLQGQSALMRAVIADQRDVVILLLEAGVNTRLVDKNHKTAKDLAKETGHMQIFTLLEQHRSR